MKAAHQGVTPSALPGLGGGSWLNASPPVAGPANNGRGAPQSNGGGVDSWLLDKLFGRH
jgi:hypothetical protein